MRSGVPWLVEHDDRARFDAFARHKVSGTFRVSKAGMTGIARTPIFDRVVAFEVDHFVWQHVGDVVPAMLGIVLKGENLPNMGRPPQIAFLEMLNLGGDEIL